MISLFIAKSRVLQRGAVAGRRYEVLKSREGEIEMEATKGKMNDKTVKLLASAGLLLVTIVWGSAFVVMKNSMDVIKPTYLLAYRFTIATAGLILIFRKQVKSMTWAEMRRPVGDFPVYQLLFPDLWAEVYDGQ